MTRRKGKRKKRFGKKAKHNIVSAGFQNFLDDLGSELSAEDFGLF